MSLEVIMVIYNMEIIEINCRAFIGHYFLRSQLFFLFYYYLLLLFLRQYEFDFVIYYMLKKITSHIYTHKNEKLQFVKKIPFQLRWNWDADTFGNLIWHSHSHANGFCIFYSTRIILKQSSKTVPNINSSRCLHNCQVFTNTLLTFCI